jgi:hypothetical protein
MTKAKPKNKVIPKRTTRFIGKTKLEKENEKALSIIRSFKGMFG